MRYLVAVLGGLLAAIVLGFGVAGIHLLVAPPVDEQVIVIARTISEGTNCAAFFALFGIPATVVYTYLRRPHRLGSGAEPGK